MWLVDTIRVVYEILSTLLFGFVAVYLCKAFWLDAEREPSIIGRSSSHSGKELVPLDAEREQPIIGRSSRHSAKDIVTLDIPNPALRDLISFAKNSLAEVSKHLFCTTDYINMASSILNKHGIVVITGKPGSGKTWCARHLLSIHSGKTRLILSKPSDWLTVPLKKKGKNGYIILIDDIFGKRTYLKSRSDEWQQMYCQIGHHVKENNVHVIITSKSHIFRKYSSATSEISLFDEDRTADLDCLKMTNNERVEMIRKYSESRSFRKSFSSGERQKAAEMTPDIGFPFCCQLFKEDESLGLNFFISPVEAMSRILIEIYDNERKMYYLLILILMENVITPSLLDPQKIAKLNLTLAADELSDLCRSLKGTFLKESTSKVSSAEYSFISAFHMNSVFLHFAGIQTRVCIMHAPLSLLLQWVSLEGESNQQYVLKPNERILLFQRLVEEISDETVEEILDHPCFKHKDCVKHLVELILRSKEKWKVKEHCENYVLFSSAKMFDKIKTLSDKKEYAKVISLPYEMEEQTEIQLFSYDHIFCWLIMKDHREAAMEFYKQWHKDELSETSVSALSCAIFMDNSDLYTEIRDSGFEASPENLKALIASSSDDPKFDDIINSKLLESVVDETLEEVLLLSVHLNHIKQVELFVQEILHRKMASDILVRVLMHKLLQLSMAKTSNCMFLNKENINQRKTVECLTKAGVTVDKTTCLFLASCQDDDVILKQFVESTSLVQDEDGVSPLHVASQYGSTDTVDILLEAGYDVNLPNNNMETPLHYAVGGNERGVIKELMKKGADLSKRDSHGCTVFHVACASGNTDAVEIFLEDIPDVNIQDDEGRTGLHFIADSNVPSSKSEAVIDLLVKGGVDVDMKNSLGETPLFKAVSKGALPVSEHLLKRGADPNTSDNQKRTPLHVCSELNIDKDSLVQVLTENGADLCLSDASCKTPLEARGQDVKMLMGAGGCSNTDNGDKRLLLDAIADRNLASTRSLLQNGVSVNIQDQDGNTPFHLAMIAKQFEFVPLLIEYEADKCIRNNLGRTVIYLCERMSSHNKTTLLEQLRPLASGINIADNYGDTPLHIAATWGETNMIRFMLNEGADPDIQNIYGETPLHNVMGNREKIEAVKLMLNKGASPNTKDKVGNTPLHVLMKEKWENDDTRETTQFMLSKGSNPDFQNKKGDTPLHVWMRRINNQDTLSPTSRQILWLILKNTSGGVTALNKQNNCEQTPMSLIAKPELLEAVRQEFKI